ncbi:hypothetical protein IGJ74_001810 [Enterococcus sp. AZ009]|uniref:hypothetical protein n=2 Tax=Enterococcus TaxID=1350 RepID=UPI001C4382BD|nr:hypothetical protein [Enterococcus casseliflavus]
MKLSIKNNGKSKFSPDYEFLIDGKPIERDRLVDITINMPADGVPRAVFTYEIDELYVEDLGVGEGPVSITAGTIKVADIKTPNIPRTDIKVDGITAGTIKAHSTTMHDIDLLAKEIAEQTAEELRISLK